MTCVFISSVTHWSAEPVRMTFSRLRCGFCVASLLLGGCSYSLGGSGSYLAPSKVASVGHSSRVMVDVSLLDIDANVAAGIDIQQLTRIGDGGDSFGQWRTNLLLGLSHMPRPHEFMLGYEGFLSPG